MDCGEDYKVFAVSYLNGQYDQRADSAAQCVQLLTRKARPLVRCARVYAVKGVTDAELARIKKHLINPVESEEVSLDKPETLRRAKMQTQDVKEIAGFIDMSVNGDRELSHKMRFRHECGRSCFRARLFQKGRPQSHRNGSQGHRYVLVGPLPPHDFRDGDRARGYSFGQSAYP